MKGIVVAEFDHESMPKASREYEDIAASVKRGAILEDKVR